MRIKIGVFAILFLVAFTSCQKEKQVSKPWKAEITTSNYLNVSSIFQQINHTSLKTAIDTKNELAVSLTVNKIANDVASYFYHHYKVDVSNDFVDNPEGLVTLGLFYAAKEKSSNQNFNQIVHDGGEFDCFLAAVGTFIGIADARNIWASLVAGASEETVIAALRLIGRRVGTVIGVGIMVYEAGDCLGFW